VICLPTTAAPAPRRGERLSARSQLRSRNSALTSIAGTIGAPQLNLPVAEVDGLPVGLSLLGARGADEMLITFAQEVANAFGMNV
jgi:amidase